MATIREIADRLGISVSTVSKGLNGASDISDTLRQQVLDTAVELGYSTKRSKKVEHRKLCLIVCHMKYQAMDEFGYDIVLGFRQNAYKNHWDVDIVEMSPEMQEKEKYDTFLLKHGYCGAFLIGFALVDPWMKQLEMTTVPTVVLDNFIPDNQNVCYLGTDSYEGIRLAVRHLHNLGHKNIAFLNGSRHSLVSDQRQEAFEKSMEELSLPLNKELMAYGWYVAECARDYVPGFLRNHATAILCGNDLIAQGVMEECHRLGYQVPEDISVIGFDDLPQAGALIPPLTTIRQERNQLGRCAFMSLNSLIQHIPISRTQLRPKLIERESTGMVRLTEKFTNIPENSISEKITSISENNT